MKYYKLCILKLPLEQSFTYAFDESLDNSELKNGELVQINFARKKTPQIAMVLDEDLNPSKDYKIKQILSKENKYLSDFSKDVSEFIRQYYVCSLSEALSVFIPYEFYDRSLEKLDIKTNIRLSEFQNEAYDFIKTKKASLLFGDTGSGKTEIYIKLIAKALKQGKDIAFLMPEISLSPQMEQRLRLCFGDLVGIWHSKISKKKKSEILQGIKEKKIRILAGARSTLFLPFNDLGLIIIDEEHDNSYKSDAKPRLNVRDLSLYIASKYDIKVVLGSATPSLNTFYKVPFFRLKKSYYKSEKHIFYDTSLNNLSPFVLDKLQSCIESKHQAIVFLPTRANFKYQVCSSCGASVECPFCSVSMSLHKNDLSLKCHYCGFSEKIPEFCPKCKTGIIRNFRIGTAQIQEELSQYFNKFCVEKFDTDTIRTDKQLRKVLNDFNKNKIDILVGTQMLSKGHDYHNVKLCVILGIDSILNMPSYKARENALSLLTQLAGRTGRKGVGEVIIQTKNQDFFRYYLGSYQKLLKDELSFRKDLYPPFKKIAKITMSNKNPDCAKKELENLSKLLDNFEGVELVGLSPARVFKVANDYRYEMLLRSSSPAKLLPCLHFLNQKKASVDMDCNI